MSKYANFSSPDNVKAKLQHALFLARKKRKARLNAGSSSPETYTFGEILSSSSAYSLKGNVLSCLKRRRLKEISFRANVGQTIKVFIAEVGPTNGAQIIATLYESAPFAATGLTNQIAIVPGIEVVPGKQYAICILKPDGSTLALFYSEAVTDPNGNFSFFSLIRSNDTTPSVGENIGDPFVSIPWAISVTSEAI